MVHPGGVIGEPFMVPLIEKINLMNQMLFRELMYTWTKKNSEGESIRYGCNLMDMMNKLTTIIPIGEKTSFMVYHPLINTLDWAVYAHIENRGQGLWVAFKYTEKSMRGRPGAPRWLQRDIPFTYYDLYMGLTLGIEAEFLTTVLLPLDIIMDDSPPLEYLKLSTIGYH